MESCVDLPKASIEEKPEDSAIAGPETCGYARMSVGGIMSWDVAAVLPDCSVADAALKMAEAMTSPVISVPASCSVNSAGKTMLDSNIRRVLVMDNRTAWAILTQTDVFQAVENRLQADEERQDRLLQAVRVEVRTKTLQMAGAVLLGGIALAGIAAGIVWWMCRGL